jgi:hypothetical protein
VTPLARKSVADALRSEVTKTRFAVKVQLLAAQAEVSEFYKPALSEIDSILGLLDAGTDAGTAEAERRFRSLRS